MKKSISGLLIIITLSSCSSMVCREVPSHAITETDGLPIAKQQDCHEEPTVFGSVMHEFGNIVGSAGRGLAGANRNTIRCTSMMNGNYVTTNCY